MSKQGFGRRIIEARSSAMGSIDVEWQKREAPATSLYQALCFQTKSAAEKALRDSADFAVKR